jgi:ABC-type multidrug transport system fused ATPase/permease subunit
MTAATDAAERLLRRAAIEEDDDDDKVRIDAFLHHFREEDEEDAAAPAKISARNLNFYYGTQQALFENNLDIAEGKITAIIGPSGCGKSTHIRIYNRIFELYGNQRAEGEVLLDGKNLLDPGTDLIELRRRVGMIFQKPTPFPLSVFENVAYGLRLHFKMPKSELNGRVESALKKAALFDEVKDKLDKPASLYPAASSSGFALPALSPWSRKFCSWMSRLRPLIRSPPAKWRSWPNR